MVSFTLAQVLGYLSYYSTELEFEQIDYYYYIANVLYMISYLFLIVKILVQLNIKTVFLELPIPILVLIVLDIFCVSIVSDTTANVLSIYEYSLENAYNAVIMGLLSVALINYMYRNDNKSMLFLLGSICIVFSDIIQLSYYYILDDNNFNFIYSFFYDDLQII